MNLIVESKQHQRVIDWLVSRGGEEAVANACKQLAGARRAYPCNIAKVLGLSPPADLAVSSSEDAQRHLDAIYLWLGIVLMRGGSDGAN